MRKRVAGKKLSRTPAQRKALYRNLIQALFERGCIKTTLVKAKIIRPKSERLITIARSGTLTARRRIASFLFKEQVAQKLFKEIAPRFQNRPGGYTRIVKLGPRKGDLTEMAMIELVGWKNGDTHRSPELTKGRRRAELPKVDAKS